MHKIGFILPVRPFICLYYNIYAILCKQSATERKIFRQKNARTFNRLTLCVNIIIINV